ncbi:hypothetical protein O181_009472 [Austropuccinia psidii MF-1]|uniref:Uncharacterized protein n=1 Tax=Austropuccinia psidii MF-1 TaxID=1389203 RepID=A0A9Q3BRU3_9BASI|nr:hypothetical protein [Austropuccinia psidii MF-1]
MFISEIIPIQHSPPEIQTRSQATAQAVLTPTARAPLEGTQEVPHLRALYGRRSTIQEGRLSRTTFKVPGEDGEEEEDNSVEEEESDSIEGVPAPVGASQGTGRPTIDQSNQPVSHQSEPSLFAIMQQMTQNMASLQAATSSDSSRSPSFKTSSMRAPECFDRTQPVKARSFIQSCQLIFNNNLANFSQDRKKVLYATSSLIGRTEKCIYPYLSNLTNQDPNYFINSCKLFEYQIFTLFKIQIILSILVDYLNTKSSPYLETQIKMEAWGERALILHFRKGLPSTIDSLQDLMDVTLELDTSYHERQKEKSNHQEKKPESSKSNASQLQNSSSSSQK